jgi:hypothetical protein
MVVVWVEQYWVKSCIARANYVIDVRIANIGNLIVANPLVIHDRNRIAENSSVWLCRSYDV